MKFLSNLLVLLVVASCGYDVGNTIPLAIRIRLPMKLFGK